MSTSPLSPLLSFGDYIRMLPTDWVFEHFVDKKSTGRKILSSSAVGEQIQKFSTPKSLVARFGALSTDLRLTCSLVYLMGERGLTVEEENLDFSHPLLRSFLVYAAKNDAGDTRLFGFNEFETPLRGAIVAELSVLGAQRRDTPPRQVEREHCLRDLAVAATLACQGVLQKKKQGGLLRSAVQQLNRLAHESPAGGDPEAFADMLVKCGVRAGLLIENDREYTCIPHAFDAWVLRPVNDRIRECAESVAAFAGNIRVSLLRALIEASPDTWFSESLVPGPERAAFVRAIRLLSWVGTVEAEQRGTSLLFGLPGPERTGVFCDGAVTIMPDFTAVIAQDADPAALFRFGTCGTLHSLDRIYKGTISRPVLDDALARGLDANEPVRWLETWHAPSNVVITVREWIREFNRLYITTHPLLVVCDDKVARQIDACADVRELVERVPAQVVYRIKPDQTERVRQLLSGMGFDPRMPDAPMPAGHAATRVGAPECGHSWRPIVAEQPRESQKTLPLHGKKYGSGLKAFDLNETMHVIEYAILTGQELSIDYSGSPHVKKGIYTVTPESCSRGGDPQLDGVCGDGRTRKFMVNRISRIGVGRP